MKKLVFILTLMLGAAGFHINGSTLQAQPESQSYFEEEILAYVVLTEQGMYAYFATESCARTFIRLNGGVLVGTDYQNYNMVFQCV